jgi:hypothetical protein
VASRSLWSSRKSPRSRASRHHWSAWNTTKKRTLLTDAFRRRDEAVALEHSTKPPESIFGPPKPRGSAEKAFAAAEVRHAGEYYVPIEHHNPMELYASTVVWEGEGKITIYDKLRACRTSTVTSAACSA